MKDQDLRQVLKHKPLLRSFLSKLLTDSEIHKSSELIIPYLTLKNMAIRKSEVKATLTLLEDEDLISILGVISNISGRTFPTNFLDMELSHNLPVNTIDDLKVKINKDKITKVLATVEETRDMKNKPVILTLSKDGKLSRIVDGEEEKHVMKPGSLDYKILECLARLRSERLSARDLALKLVIEKIGKKRKTSPEKLIRDRILAIKKIITKKFIGIDPESFIPHADENNGYCLGKTIKIKTSNY